eukprot:UN23837
MNCILILFLTGYWPTSISIHFISGREVIESCQHSDRFYDLHVKLRNKKIIPPSSVGTFVTLGSND